MWTYYLPEQRRNLLLGGLGILLSTLAMWMIGFDRGSLIWLALWATNWATAIYTGLMYGKYTAEALRRYMSEHLTDIASASLYAAKTGAVAEGGVDGIDIKVVTEPLFRSGVAIYMRIWGDFRNSPQYSISTGWPTPIPRKDTEDHVTLRKRIGTRINNGSASARKSVNRLRSRIARRV
jgi:hypothetical protein